MSLENNSYERNPLWPILTETTHALTMYQYHKRYVQNTLLQKNPNITPKEISIELNITIGEALVILFELKPKKE